MKLDFLSARHRGIDPDGTDRSAWVRATALTAALAYALVLALGFVRPKPPSDWLSESAALIACLLAVGAVGAGRARVGGLLVVGAIWLEAHVALAAVGDLRAASALVAFPVLVMAAGLLHGRRAAVGFAVVSAFSVPFAAALSGWLGIGPGLAPGDLNLLVAMTASLIGAALVTALGLESFRAALERANASERRFRDLFEQSPDGIVSIDGAGIIDAANPVAERILDRRLDRLLGRSPAELGVHLDARKPGISETRIEHADGSFTLVEGLWQVGSGGSTQLVLRDVTGRRAAEARATQFGNIVEGVQSEIYVFRAEAPLQILLVNRGARENLGYTSSDLLGVPVWLVNPGLCPERGLELRSRFEADPGEVVRSHGVHVRKDGSQYPVDLHLQSDEVEGRPVVVAFAMDATRRLEAEAEQRRLQGQLLHAQKMEAVGLLAGGIAHDFNNLLTVVASGVEAFPDEPGEERDEILEELRGAVHRGATLTRQLLAFARREVVQPRLVDFGRVVLGMKTLLERLVGEGIALDFDVGGSAPVVADAGQLEQVLLNLVANSRDALPKRGRIRIRVCRSPDQSHAVLTVEDDGAGIDPEVQDRIFDPFFTTKPEGKGTGLGLSTVHGIVEQAGGRIEVESHIGVGTRVEIWLPSALEDGDRLATPDAAREVEASGVTVLVAEDNEGTRIAVCRMLERAGYRVLSAVGGQAALDVLNARRHEVDVLLSDVVMPDMSGVELARVFCRLAPEIPVTFMSGYVDESLRKHMGEHGVDQLILKPFDSRQVTEHLERALSRKGRLPARSRPPRDARTLHAVVEP